MVDDDAENQVFNPKLSALLTANLESDDVQGMLSTLAEAGLSAEHLGGHLSRDIHLRPRGCCRSSSIRLTSPSSSVSFSRVAHLSMLTQSSQVLSFLSVSHPRLLMMLDDSGSGVLHCLAMASVLLRSCASSRRLSAGFETFQTRVFRILSDAECPSSDLGSTSTSLLHSLCLMENSAGLRPIEFSILVGAYSTFHCILNVQGYILTKQVSHGIRVRSTYDLTEYDLMKGDRRDKSPMLMLTLISSDQADPLAESGVLETPIIKKWLKSIIDEMFCPMYGHRASIIIFALVFSPISFWFNQPSTLLRAGYQLETGFVEYAAYVRGKVNVSLANASAVEAGVREYCQPTHLRDFLMTPSNPVNKEILLQSPLTSTPVSRGDIVANCYNVLIILAFFQAFRLVTIVFTVYESKKFFAQRWMPVRMSKLLVQTHFYDAAYVLGFATGLLYIIIATQFDKFLDCSDYVLGSSTDTFWLSVSVQSAECVAVLYALLNMFGLFDAYEMALKHAAFLCICFRKMLVSFALVLPLLLFWAYLVFGTLLYMADSKGQEFSSQHRVLYSPLRLITNMASLPFTLSCSLLHTLFVLTVTFGIQSFIIGYIVNAFKEVATNFEVVYHLSALANALRTWRLYPWLLRMARSSRRHCGWNHDYNIIRVWSFRSSTGR